MTRSAPVRSRTQADAIADVYAFAFLQWPALVGLLALGSESWELAVRIGLAGWLALMQLAAYGRGHGAQFGHGMLMLAGCVAGCWWAYPGPWIYPWLALILVGMYAVQRSALARCAGAAACAPGCSGEADETPARGSG